MSTVSYIVTTGESSSMAAILERISNSFQTSKKSSSSSSSDRLQSVSIVSLLQEIKSSIEMKDMKYKCGLNIKNVIFGIDCGSVTSCSADYAALLTIFQFLCLVEFTGSITVTVIVQSLKSPFWHTLRDWIENTKSNRTVHRKVISMDSIFMSDSLGSLYKAIWAPAGIMYPIHVRQLFHLDHSVATLNQTADTICVAITDDTREFIEASSIVRSRTLSSILQSIVDKIKTFSCEYLISPDWKDMTLISDSLKSLPSSLGNVISLPSQSHGVDFSGEVQPSQLNDIRLPDSWGSFLSQYNLRHIRLAVTGFLSHGAARDVAKELCLTNITPLSAIMFVINKRSMLRNSAVVGDKMRSLDVVDYHKIDESIMAISNQYQTVREEKKLQASQVPPTSLTKQKSIKSVKQSSSNIAAEEKSAAVLNTIKASYQREISSETEERNDGNMNELLIASVVTHLSEIISDYRIRRAEIAKLLSPESSSSSSDNDDTNKPNTSLDFNDSTETIKLSQDVFEASIRDWGTFSYDIRNSNPSIPTNLDTNIDVFGDESELLIMSEMNKNDTLLNSEVHYGCIPPSVIFPTWLILQCMRIEAIARFECQKKGYVMDLSNISMSRRRIAELAPCFNVQVTGRSSGSRAGRDSLFGIPHIKCIAVNDSCDDTVKNLTRAFPLAGSQLKVIIDQHVLEKSSGLNELISQANTISVQGQGSVIVEQISSIIGKPGWLNFENGGGNGIDNDDGVFENENTDGLIEVKQEEEEKSSFMSRQSSPKTRQQQSSTSDQFSNMDAETLAKLEERSRKYSNFLLATILPHVAESLLHVQETKPKNPLSCMIEVLKRKAAWLEDVAYSQAYLSFRGDIEKAKFEEEIEENEKMSFRDE